MSSSSFLLDPFYYSDIAIAIAASSASLSTISSVIIVTTICRSQVRFSSVYNRIILGMSLFDIIGSVSVALTTVPMPVDQMYPFSHTYGTVSTCAAQGFLITLACGVTLLYSAGLGFFHLCLINFKVNDESIRKFVEPTIHVISLTIPISFCIYFQTADLFNPGPIDAWCTHTMYPFDCFFDEEIECIRGNVDAMSIAYRVILTVILLSLLCVITCMIIIIIGACRNNVDVETISTNRNQRGTPFTRETLNILLVKQAILYMFGILLTWIFPVVTIIMNDSIIFYVLTLIFWPLQGFFNALIFIHNKVYNIRRHDESITSCEALNLIFIHPGKMPEMYLSQLRRVEADHRRKERIRDEFVARTQNVNNDNDGSYDVGFPMSIREEISLIFDDINMIYQGNPGDNADYHVSGNLEDIQNQPVMPLSEVSEVYESNNAKVTGDDSDADLCLEENSPMSLSEAFDSKDDSISSKFEQVSLPNSNLSLDSSWFNKMAS